MTGATRQLSTRDRAVVQLVGKFKQLTARQIGQVLFADLASKTPLDRCLKRLTDHGYLSRLNVRPIGGDGGGSAQYVYQLGRAGWRLLGMAGRYWVHRSVNLHAIELVDVYVRLKAIEGQGGVTIVRFDMEREAWRDIGGSIRLTPDAYVELGFAMTGMKILNFLELDRGTERADKIRDKCLRYWRAYQTWGEKVFPYVVFLVPDEARRLEIQRVIRSAPAGAEPLFRVGCLTELEWVINAIATPAQGEPSFADQSAHHGPSQAVRGPTLVLDQGAVNAGNPEGTDEISTMY